MQQGGGATGAVHGEQAHGVGCSLVLVRSQHLGQAPNLLQVEEALARGGVEEYAGRDVRPEDNGFASGKHLAREFPVRHQPLRGLPGRRALEPAS